MEYQKKILIPQYYETLYEAHTNECSVNLWGSSGKMERNAMKEMFR